MEQPNKPRPPEKDIAALPGRWVSLDDRRIRKLRPQYGEDTGYTLGRGAAQNLGFVGQFNFSNGVVVVGAPDGSLRVAPHTSVLVDQLVAAGYKLRELIGVPNLLDDELFDDPLLQAEFLALLTRPSSSAT